MRRDGGFSVRKAAAEDVNDIVRIQRAAVEKAWRKAIPGDFAVFLNEKFDPAVQRVKYLERVADPKIIILVVEKSDHVIGFCGVRPHGIEEAPPGFDWQGNAFYLDPAFEGSGGSLILFSGLLDAVRERGARSLVGWCLADNRLARNFYARRGGKIVQDAIAPPEYSIAPHVAYGWQL